MTATIGARRAAPWHARVRAQTAMELGLLLRNGENLLVALGIPAGLLVLFTLVPVLPTDGRSAVAFLLPGVLVIALMGSTLVSLAITTGFERSYLVLKRLGATPLRRVELVMAKLLAVVIVQAGQIGLLVGVAWLLGWRPADGVSPGLLVAGLGLGTAAFAGIALAMAGRLRALATLALANAAFVLLMLLSGLVFPLSVLPGWLQAVMTVLPAAPLAQVLTAALDGAAGGVPWLPLGILAAWAIATPAAAAALFRWE